VLGKMGAIEIPERAVYHFFTKGRLRNGRGGFGGVICDGFDKELCGYNGADNNIECIGLDYLALIRGFELLDARSESVVRCHVNNQTVVKQLAGDFRIGKEYLKELVERLDDVSRLVCGVGFEFVSGDGIGMERAKLLAGFAMDGQMIS
jgi:hypothetical protein